MPRKLVTHLYRQLDSDPSWTRPLDLAVDGWGGERRSSLFSTDCCVGAADPVSMSVGSCVGLLVLLASVLNGIVDALQTFLCTVVPFYKVIFEAYSRSCGTRHVSCCVARSNASSKFGQFLRSIRSIIEGLAKRSVVPGFFRNARFLNLLVEALGLLRLMTRDSSVLCSVEKHISLVTYAK